MSYITFFNHGALSILDFHSAQTVHLLHHHPTPYSAILTQHGLTDEQNLWTQQDFMETVKSGLVQRPILGMFLLLVLTLLKGKLG